MKLDNEVVDQLSKEIDAHDKVVPGVKGGADYPEFALALIGSEWFKNSVRTSILMSMVELMMNREQAKDVMENKGKDSAEMKGLLDRWAESSPHRAEILDAAYLGYRLGKLSKEG